MRTLARVVLACMLASAGAAVRAQDGPVWAQLTSDQQTALRPLQARWNRLPDYQRTRLLGAAKRYAALTPAQQQRFTQRLDRWSALSLPERERARLAYKEYARLSDAERRQIRERWLKAYPEMSMAAIQNDDGD